MTDPSRLFHQINDEAEANPSAREVLDCLEEYPYFSVLAYAWLKRSVTEGFDPSEEELRKKIALYVVLGTPGDGRKLQFATLDLLDNKVESEPFYPIEELPKAPTTLDAIDTFLDNYAKGSDNSEEVKVLENLIMNPIVDYAAVLDAEEKTSLPEPEETSENEQDSVINKFILEHRSPEPVKIEEFDQEKPLESPAPIPDSRPISTPPKIREDAPLSESLSKIYIKRKNYKGAREIIAKLNLKYPEKSIYFAVQLRFLDKLIENSRRLESLESQN